MRVRDRFGIMAVLVVGGCGTVPPARNTAPSGHGDASFRQVELPGTARYQLALGQTASGADPQVQPSPTYPPELVQAHLAPVEVMAKLIVDTEGRVSEVRIAATGDANRQRFNQAVRDVASQWLFHPMVISRWAADANGESHSVDAAAQPFSLDYAFDFAWRDGRPTVTSAALPH